MATSRLFESLDDETPPTTGEEIGAALAPALAEIAAAGERQAKMIAELGDMLAQAMADAIKQAGDRQVVVQGQPAPQVLRWEFEIMHNASGRLARVIATAGGVH